VKSVDCPVKQRGKFWFTPFTKLPPISYFPLIFDIHP